MILGKKDFIKEVSDIINEGITWREDRISRDTIKRVFDGVEDLLYDISSGVAKNADGETIEGISYAGVGKFTLVDIKERVTKNLHNDEEVVIPAHKEGKFKTARKLKRASMDKDVD